MSRQCLPRGRDRGHLRRAEAAFGVSPLERDAPSLDIPARGLPDFDVCFVDVPRLDGADRCLEARKPGREPMSQNTPPFPMAVWYEWSDATARQQEWSGEIISRAKFLAAIRRCRAAGEPSSGCSRASRNSGGTAGRQNREGAVNAVIDDDVAGRRRGSSLASRSSRWRASAEPYPAAISYQVRAVARSASALQCDG